MAKLRILILFPVLLTSLLFAQGERAVISGTVTDSTGALVPDVGITVRNELTNIARRVESNTSGLFVVPALEPGSYALSAEKQGFRLFRVTGIPLSVGLTATINVKLEVGQVSEAVEVTANAVQLEAQSSGMGETVETRRVVELPLLGRDPRQLSALAPGVIPSRGQVAAGGSTIGFAGNSRIGGSRNAERHSDGRRRYPWLHLWWPVLHISTGIGS